MIHAGSGAKSSCCGSLQDSLFFCTATLRVQYRFQFNFALVVQLHRNVDDDHRGSGIGSAMMFVGAPTCAFFRIVEVTSRKVLRMIILQKN